MGFTSTHASGRSDAFALSGSNPDLLPDTAVFAQQLQAALPQDTQSPLPLLLFPSDPNQPWKLLNAAGHGCDAHLSVMAAPSFPQLLTPEGVMNLGRDQCSALSQALF